MMIGRMAPPKAGRLELADAVLPGLSLRITPDGTRTFALRYRIDGKQQRLTLGRYDPERFNLAAARAKARTALDQRRRRQGPRQGPSARWGPSGARWRRWSTTSRNGTCAGTPSALTTSSRCSAATS